MPSRTQKQLMLATVSPMRLCAGLEPLDPEMAIGLGPMVQRGDTRIGEIVTDVDQMERVNQMENAVGLLA
jgi:hypothetical protein